MATCPSCATVLSAMPNDGVGDYLVCTGCKQHYYATGGIMLRSPFTTGGKVTFASGPTYAVSHGLLVEPNDYELSVTPATTNANSGAWFYISATSSLNFVITMDGTANSGIKFVWKYTKA